MSLYVVWFPCQPSSYGVPWLKKNIPFVWTSDTFTVSISPKLWTLFFPSNSIVFPWFFHLIPSPDLHICRWTNGLQRVNRVKPMKPRGGGPKEGRHMGPGRRGKGRLNHLKLRIWHMKWYENRYEMIFFNITVISIDSIVFWNSHTVVFYWNSFCPDPTCPQVLRFSLPYMDWTGASTARCVYSLSETYSQDFAG